jgi:nitrite reductase/ring-hydroxylating ferredoxin subunit
VTIVDEAGARTRVCEEGDLAPGDMRIMHGGRRKVLLCRAENGEYFAVASKCPHQGAGLVAGTFGGSIAAADVGRYRYDNACATVRCPWHGWEYDARTGAPLAGGNPTRIAVYTVVVIDGAVYVDDAPRGRIT